MKFITFFTLVALAVATPLLLDDSINYFDAAQTENVFQQWLSRFPRSYTLSSPEYFYRLGVFRESLLRSWLKNRNEAGKPEGTRAVFGLGPFADSTVEESRARRGFRVSHLTNVKHKSIRPIPVQPVVAPAAVDWRLKGAVSPVKDQGQCGSCWAFSVTETVESFWYLSNGSLPILSPQQIVDCDGFPLDNGCNGGTTQFAYEYVMGSGGLDTEYDYPYQSGDSGDKGVCSFDPTQVAASIKGWDYATPVCADISCNKQDEDKLAESLATVGPVSVCLNAGAWDDYVSGVMDGVTCGAHDLLSMDHCVQLVGYNKTTTPPYWIVRNSWNVDWGVAGYIYLAMGNNTCGIANIATQVTVN